MNQFHRLSRLARTLFDRAFLLIFPGLLLATTPAPAQTEKAPDPPACTQPALPKAAESFLNTSAANDCAAKNSAALSTPDNAETPGSTATAPTEIQTTLINHRLLGVVANYTTVETEDHYGRLSASTKFKLTAKTMTDPITVSFIAGVALLGQARNSDPTYGQGFVGYDKRFGTFYADTGIGTLMTSSVFPTVLHQDPRYFQLGAGGFRRRLLHAMGSILIAHSDTGALQLNYSQFVGNAVAAGISNTYHPASQRTLGNTFRIWGSDTGVNMLCNVAKEFWPDVRRRLHGRQASN